MGWNRRNRARHQVRCSVREMRRAHDRGPAALAAYLAVCGSKGPRAAVKAAAGARVKAKARARTRKPARRR